MGDKHYFDEKLNKRGKAEEDLWFARRDRELLEIKRREQQPSEPLPPDDPVEP